MATTLQPTSYTEINRIHRSTLASAEGALVVTCSRNGEGTSLLAYTLALRAAESGKRTLLVDLNMRNTNLSAELNLPRKEWKLAERAPNDSFIDLVETAENMPTLSFLAAPRDQDSVVFLKDLTHAEQFFQTLKQYFDHIIVDTTPVGVTNRANADSVILAAAADRTVLMLMAAVTPRERVRRALRQLQEGGANVEGVVVNDSKNPSLKEDMLKFARGFKRLSPGFSSWLTQKINNSDALS